MVVLPLVCLRLSNNAFTLALLVFLFSLLYNFHMAIWFCRHFGCPTIIIKPQFIILIWLKIVMPPTLPTPPSVSVVVRTSAAGSTGPILFHYCMNLCHFQIRVWVWDVVSTSSILSQPVWNTGYPKGALLSKDTRLP